jgi:RNA polymerase sigma factor for flagellar operon FliA
VRQPKAPETELVRDPANAERPVSMKAARPCPARAALERGVNAYLPLVRRVVKQLARRLPSNVQRDDLLAAGAFGLVDSLRRNGGDEGAAFEWYARTRIRGAIFDELRSQDWLSRRARAAGGVTACVVSIEDVAGDDESGLAGTSDPSEVFESRSLCRALARALLQLSERERIVVARHYLEGSRLKDIGAELGVSEPRISQILARALARLREILRVETA